jgi:spore maturation protein CgeB
MSAGLNIRYFAHSWVSDWNHGNAHFLRGLARELGKLGNKVRCYEALGSWSLTNLLRHEGERAIDAIDYFRKTYPDLDIHFYRSESGLQDHLMRELRGADVVILHEWNDPELVNTVLDLRQQLGFRALLHDTHHRAYTSPRDLLRFHLHLFDGVLAFGEAISRIYADGFGMQQVWTFHEAADIEHFRPINANKDADVVWIGNWGDEERTRELGEFLISPARSLPGTKFVVHGVRYPDQGLAVLADAGIEYRGYLPNLKAPVAYGSAALSVHIPRREYSNGLSGIPTIRVFEALACGIPLLCAPWQDLENLFHPGEDYICVPNGAAMTAEISRLLADPLARRQIASNGLKTLRARHTCRHRAVELSQILQQVAR